MLSRHFWGILKKLKRIRPSCALTQTNDTDAFCTKSNTCYQEESLAIGRLQHQLKHIIINQPE
jgi:hypothetical protein